jgi:ribosomal protein L32
MTTINARPRRSFWRWLLRQWAVVAVAVLALLAGWTGYELWDAGLPKGLAFVPRLALYLALIAAVIVLRRVGGRLFSRALAQGTARLKQEMAGDLVSQGRQRAGSWVDRGAMGARSAWAGLTGKDWQRPAGTQRGMPAPGAAAYVQRCPSCGRTSRPGAVWCDGCGALLDDKCPQCGRPVRRGARYCDDCGAPLTEGARRRRARQQRE